MCSAYSADIVSISPSDRVMHLAPLSHGAGLYLLPAIAAGAENEIFTELHFDADVVLQALVRQQTTVISFLVPTMIGRLVDGHEDMALPSLRCATYGGAPISARHLVRGDPAFGPVFAQIYGQGESPMTITGLSMSDHARIPLSDPIPAGWARTGVAVAVVDSQGREVPRGTAGEVIVRGDVVMVGYWRDERATDAAIIDGWLHTGDIGVMDASGLISLVDRVTDLVITGGANVYPSEVEVVLRQHPEVEDVVVFGLPDEEWGETVAAAVVVTRGADVSSVELIEWCSGYLASFKKPKTVVFLDELPRNAYGKILRREVKAQCGVHR